MYWQTDIGGGVAKEGVGLPILDRATGGGGVLGADGLRCSGLCGAPTARTARDHSRPVRVPVTMPPVWAAESAGLLHGDSERAAR